MSKSQTAIPPEQKFISSELTAKFNAINFSIDYVIKQNVYSSENAHIIQEQLHQIYTLLHSKGCPDTRNVTIDIIPDLERNLQNHNFKELLAPYEELFNDYDIKIRSFPTSIINEDDSQTIFGFDSLLKSTLVYLSSRKNIHHAFDVFHSLDSSIIRYSEIVGRLIKNDAIGDDYYQILSQINENLINLQSILNLAFEIENDCQALANFFGKHK